MNFYIADTHFGHKNIIRYDNRPFFSVGDMDKELITRWNKAVSKSDHVYILGDFSWYDLDKTLEIVRSLNGHKHLIRGNHDNLFPKSLPEIEGICDYCEIKDGKERLVLSHYPMLFWNGQFRDSIHLYGHVHNSHQWNACESFKEELKQLQDIPMRMFNVGCMIPGMDYTPRTIEEILSFNG